MNIGLIVDNYHTEILDFLFELLSEFSIIWYHNNDIYDNKSIYMLKYKNIIVKQLDSFINETDAILIDIHCYKEQKYNNSNKILITHSLNDIEYCKSFNLKYITLNPFTTDTENLFLPFIKTPNEIHDMSLSLQDKIPLLCIGHTFENNIMKQYLDKNYIIFVFTSQYENVLTNNIDNVIIIKGKTTLEIINYIKYFNIKHVLFTPNNLELWSGCISFAINNALNLILPEMYSNKIFKNKYKNIITYNENISFYRHGIEQHLTCKITPNDTTYLNFNDFLHTNFYKNKKNLLKMIHDVK